MIDVQKKNKINIRKTKYFLISLLKPSDQVLSEGIEKLTPGQKCFLIQLESLSPVLLYNYLYQWNVVKELIALRINILYENKFANEILLPVYNL